MAMTVRATADGPCYILDEMTWTEFQKARATVDLALIPVGSTEQHGPHGTFGVDAGRAYGFAVRLGRELHPRAVVAPVMPYGVSPHHMRFPGTITLEPELFVAVLFQIVQSLHAHGLRKFFFLNGHGGNRPALSLLMQKLMVEFPDSQCGWTSFTGLARNANKEHIRSEISGHACEGEMSQSLVLAPWTFHKESAVPGGPFKISPAEHHLAGIDISRRFDEITENGALGDARSASVEAGEAIVAEAMERAIEFLRTF